MMTMKLILSFFIFSTFLIMNFSSPLTLLINILTQVIFLCLLMWLSFNTSWYAFILFLIYLGGLMVLFIYITSLASNEKLTINMNLLFSMVIFSFFMLFTFWYKKNFMDLSFMKYILHLNLNLMFNTSNMKFSIFAMIYLLFSLIVVIKICNKLSAPMKSYLK